jgi:DNA replication protein DnaC
MSDELGYPPFSRTGAELLFQVFADRYEQALLLVTSNLPSPPAQQERKGCAP